jgi:hypothetical protein
MPGIVNNEDLVQYVPELGKQLLDKKLSLVCVVDESYLWPPLSDDSCSSSDFAIINVARVLHVTEILVTTPNRQSVLGRSSLFVTLEACKPSTQLLRVLPMIQSC